MRQVRWWRMQASARKGDGREGCREVAWGARRLAPGALYHGVVRRPDQVELLARAGLRGVSREGDARVVVIEASGLVAPWRGARWDVWWCAGVGERWPVACREAHRHGAFDVGVLLVEATWQRARWHAGREAEGLAWLAAQAPRRPWVVLGLGEAGYGDALMRALRYRGNALEFDGDGIGGG